MTFDDILEQVITLLKRQGCVSYRALKMRFGDRHSKRYFSAPLPVTTLREPGKRWGLCHMPAGRRKCLQEVALQEERSEGQGGGYGRLQRNVIAP